MPAAFARGGVGEQVDVGADDRERRPELVGDDREQLGARRVELAQPVELRLGLGLERGPSRRCPASSAAIVEQELDLVARRTRRASVVWTLSTPTTESFQTSGTDSIAWRSCDVEAADPREPRVGGDVGRR